MFDSVKNEDYMPNNIQDNINDDENSETVSEEEK